MRSIGAGAGEVMERELDALGLSGNEARVLLAVLRLGTANSIEAYHRAGVGARIVDALPVKMAVFDRAVALIALMDGDPTDNAYPSFLLVEHEGFATYQAEAFDYRWAGGRPYETARHD